MAYPSDLIDEQWALLRPVFAQPGKREHAGVRRVLLAVVAGSTDEEDIVAFISSARDPL